MLTKRVPPLVPFLRHAAIFFVGYVCVPFWLHARLSTLTLGHLIIFYCALTVTAVVLIKRHSQRTSLLGIDQEQLQENVNVAGEELAKGHAHQQALHEKINRYQSLKQIIEEINLSLSLRVITEHLCTISFKLIGHTQGVCTLYLVDAQTKRLGLFTAQKEDKKLVIKAKEGDAFDYWVLRHASPLLVEDSRKDFRFDLTRLHLTDERPIGSVVSVPLISGHSFLGIIRLDHPQPHFYTQDDLRFLLTIGDIGAVAIENGQFFEQTQDLAMHDELTGFFTRNYFQQRLGEECRRSLRHRTPLSILMLDIDTFKKYNDRFGHTAGDMVLRALAQTIAESLKDHGPVLSRFGGEEFCVLLPGIVKAKAVELAGSLRLAIEHLRITLRRQETLVTVSIGVASFPEDTVQEEELLLKVDQALYQAKQKGRNRVCQA